MVQQQQAVVFGIDDFNDIGNDMKVIDLQSYMFPNFDVTNNVNDVVNAVEHSKNNPFPENLNFGANT